MSAYASVTSVGGLLPTSLLERVRAGDAKIPGTTPESYGLVPGERHRRSRHTVVEPAARRVGELHDTARPAARVRPCDDVDA